MNVVKLNKTHRLYQEGYTHAFRFASYNTEAIKIEKTLIKQFGSNWKLDAEWTARFGYKRSDATRRIYWIGFKSEAMLTMALLGL